MSRRASISFAVLLCLCLAQVGWWVYFQRQQTLTLHAVDTALARGDATAAATLLGEGEPVATRADRRWRMIASEGAALSLAVVIAAVLFYLALARERRTRAAHARFLAGATHELKTPLATLRLGLDSLRSGRLDAARSVQYANSMAVEVDRLQRDVEDLLAAAELRTTEQHLCLEPGDLADDADAVLAAFGPRLQREGIELHRELQPGVRIRRDARAMATVIRNLLDNACKYGGGGPVSIAVRREGDHAALSVRDTGPGIPAEERGQVFEPLFRGSRAPHVGGTGLGLFLTAQLVRRHGGTVRAGTNPAGRGTELHVTLPLENSA